MFSCVLNVFLSAVTFIIISRTCLCDLPTPPASLYLYSPGELEYTEVLVRRVNDNLTLVCELRGDSNKRDFVWNFMPGYNGSSGGSPQPLAPEPLPEAPHRSMLVKLNLTEADTGRYMCSSPPFSQTKFILVQTITPKHCARGAFACGQRCVLPAYVCDGRPDCLRQEDEAPALCHQPCHGPDKLNCSNGRCIPSAACCGALTSLCRQPACCDQHARYSRLQASFDDFPLPPEDRHAPDDYGFIQSTIYTVTACALIFMIAVVLLVSAICKMHMKRAALRSYAAAERATRRHYSAQYAQTHRFPPCYEASRLLDEPRAPALSPHSPHSPHDSPTRLAMQCAVEAPNSPDAGFGLGRLSEIFSSRYRQVPTQCCEVEMQNVRPTSLNNSPTRTQNLDFRSPTYCDLNSAEFYFTNPEAGECGRDLNSMSTPVELFRRRSMARGGRPRPYTLQLGRFQLSIPKLGRRGPNPRPDTPNVAEIDIDDLDFVRLDSNDTYTLNGRTIRLLGANFENYPMLSDGSIRPPPYTEAMRYKLYGPPPEYLSRDGLNRNHVDEEARNNVEMPPNYDELGDGASTSGRGETGIAGSSGANGASIGNEGNSSSMSNTTNDGIGTGNISSVPSTSTGNGTGMRSISDGPSISAVNNSLSNASNISNNNVSEVNSCLMNNATNTNGNKNDSEMSNSLNNANNNNTNTSSTDNLNINSVSALKPSTNNNTCSDISQPSTSHNNNPVESIKAVIDNLPAIDSDVNANEAEA